MNGSTQNIVFKLLSLAAGAAFTLAVGAVVSGWESAKIISLAAAFIAVPSIIGLNFLFKRSAEQISEATDIAHKLSNGEDFTTENSSGLIESLSGVSTYLNQKAILCSRIADGDLSESVTPSSDADMLGNSMHLMVGNLRQMILTKEKRDSLQHSISKLLREVSDVSAGDLTVHAERGSDVTGEIAEAFNSMTRNLRSLIKQVKDVAVQIDSFANSINDTTEQLARGSDIQSSQIVRTSSAVATLTEQVQDVSEKALLSSRVAERSLENARLGTSAAHENIKAIEIIRRQAQETAKRVKKLGERSQEISQIVLLIDDLSDRTSLLALNAALQAAAAGESGSAFAKVAGEVESLAVSTSRLTDQIGDLTRKINSETKDVVGSMEEMIREIVVGSALANKAGRSLVEIEQVSAQLAGLIGSISDSAHYQARNSEDIAKAMSGIAEVTSLVEGGSKRAAESVRILVQLSNELRNSVAPFKLPADIQPEPPNAENIGILVN